MSERRTAGKPVRQRNVLITGVTGTLGRQLAQHLYFDKGIGTIIGIAKDERPYYFDEYDPKKFVYSQVDLTKFREVNNLFFSDTYKDAQIDTVIHLAFQNRPSMHGEKSHALNVLGTKNILEKCIETPGITKFIFKSSGIVYRVLPHGDVLLDEESDLNFDASANQWIKDRVDADMLCRSRMDNKKVDIVVMRFSNIVGRNIHSQLNEYLQSAIVLRPAGYDPMVNLIDVKDVIGSIRQAIEKKTRGVFNIVGKDTAPLSVFVRQSGSKVVSLPAPLMVPANQLQRRLGITTFNYEVDQRRLRFSALLAGTKAETVLGYSPRHHVDFG
jgi:UDP-glucose 4-epimerase